LRAFRGCKGVWSWTRVRYGRDSRIHRSSSRLPSVHATVTRRICGVRSFIRTFIASLFGDNMQRRHFLAGVPAAALALGASPLSFAQKRSFPSQPVTLIVPFPP